MFNLFKKAKQEEVVATIQSEHKKYPAVVEQIHNEFFTAGDEILNEAACLLKELEQKDLSKGKRLASLGFSKTREAVVAIETENKLATTKEIADLVMYYRANYPNNKFITEEQVKAICEKYGLVCGEVGLFKGFVPEKKMVDIEKFKLKEEDKFDTKKPIYFATSSNLTNDWKVISVTEKDFTSEHIKKYINTSYHYISHVCPSLNNGEGKIVSHLAQPDLINNKIKLQICAPIKDMDVNGLFIKEGYKLIAKINVPDPVVLQPVNGGYLIVCAWGDEASDPIVVNEINN